MLQYIEDLPEVQTLDSYSFALSITPTNFFQEANRVRHTRTFVPETMLLRHH